MTPPPPPTPASASAPADHITIDHILIGVKGDNGLKSTRTVAEARTFAYDLLTKLRAGADWGTAKRANSEDPPPGGPYSLADSNRGVKPSSSGEYARNSMVPAFGDVGFTLAVGEIGIADYDATTSPFGFHIIKRVK